MSLRRLISVLSVVVATGGVALAQAKKEPAPATPAPGAGSAAAPAGEGSAVQPIDDAPPSDMEGRDENPDAPRSGPEEPVAPTGPVAPVAPTGYPVEEALRPITLPANMAEVSIAPHFRVRPFEFSDALRARYGITSRIQLGLTYGYGGVFDDPATVKKEYTFHVGKAAGLDVTVLMTNWLGVRVGLPVYFDPFAMGLTLGAPMRFRFEKFTLGGMDDLLTVALPFEAEFAPSFYSEKQNVVAAEKDRTISTQSRGSLRFSGYGIYQQKANLALIGRLAVEVEDFSGNRNDRGYGGITTSLKVGAQLTPKPFLDVGAYIGFDDLADEGSFGLQGFLAVRI